jgi:molecular chaperone GrpE (heat shock protein)
MSEEKVEGKEPEVKEPEQKKPQASDQAAQKADEHGWRPEDEFYADPDNEGKVWVSAEEFNRRGELFEKIEELKGKINHRDQEFQELRSTLNKFKKHYEKVDEAAYKRAMDDLKKQKLEALENHEAAKVLEVDERIDALKDERAEAKALEMREMAAPKAEVVDPRFTAWVDRNRWYAQDQDMRNFADSLGFAYAKSRPGVDPSEVLKHVEQQVKKAYPDKFTNPNRDKPSAVEGGTRGSGSNKRAVDDVVLTDDEEKAMRAFIKSGAIKDESEYRKSIRELEKAGVR